ncbi:MAG: hypothetical protein KC933_32965, partial [Myxococcales bacterium]|nr:hypothetical protein [Myxococcales bacterium]
MGRDDGRDRGWADIVGPLDETPDLRPAAPPEAPPGPALDFSAQELVSALDASPAAATEAPGDPRNRRAIWTVALGLAVVVGAVVVTASTREPPPAPK